LNYRGIRYVETPLFLLLPDFEKLRLHKMRLQS